MCDYGTDLKSNLTAHYLRHTRPMSEKYFCLRCNDGFGTLEELKSHRETAHENVSGFTCKYCGKSYKTRHKLMSHETEHEQEDVVGNPATHCVHCGYVPKTKVCLAAHYKWMGEFHSNKCVQCPEKFATYEEHVNHVKQVHNNVWVYICGNCEQTFDSKFARDKHRRDNHMGQHKDWVCDICGQSMTQAFKPTHMRQAHGEEPTPCDICGKMFRHPKVMQQHKDRCHGHWPCETCGKVFAHPDRLKLHAATHMPEEMKPYKCHICGKGFIVEPRLKNHIKLHLNLREFKCRYCDARYNNNSSVRTHEREKHLGVVRRKKHQH